MHTRKFISVLICRISRLQIAEVPTRNRKGKAGTNHRALAFRTKEQGPAMLRMFFFSR